MFGKKSEQTEPDLQLFMIYDSKVGAYERPQWCVNQHDLVRQVINLFTEPGQERNKYLVNAEDFSFFKFGDLYLKTGRFVPCDPTNVANAHELRSIAERQKTQARPDLGIAST